MACNKNDNSLHITMKSKQRMKQQNLAVLKLKSTTELNEKKLLRAVTLNNIEQVSELLANNVSPNVADNLQRSSLHLAASRNYKEMTSLLLRYGADPNQRDIIGNTALHLAACSNNIEIITLLLDAGTDVTSLDKRGRNPLQLAQSKLRILQHNYKEGTIELTQLRVQLQQIIELMQSFVKRQSNSYDEHQIMNLSISDSSETDIDNQMSRLLTAIQDISLK